MWLEGKYATASSEALWVHHLQARRLYGQIYGSLYGVLRPNERDTSVRPEDVVTRYVHQVQQWYMWSRFNATVVPFSDDTVKRHVCRLSFMPLKLILLIYGSCSTTYNTIRL